jgi:hypothetical protein
MLARLFDVCVNRNMSWDLHFTQMPSTNRDWDITFEKREVTRPGSHFKRD